MPAVHTTPLAFALRHLWHVVRYADLDGVRSAVQRVVRAGGSQALNLGMDGEQTPLNSLVCGGHVRCLDLLLAAGADPNLPMEHGNTALHRAVSADRLDLVTVLLRHGANPSCCNHRGQRPSDLTSNAGVRAVLEQAALRQALTGSFPAGALERTRL